MAVRSDRSGRAVLRLAADVLSAVVLSAGAAFAQAAPAAQAVPAKSPYVFASDGAAILNFVKADKVADFEMVMEKVREALAKSEKPERKQQAAGWVRRNVRSL